MVASQIQINSAVEKRWPKSVENTYKDKFIHQRKGKPDLDKLSEKQKKGTSYSSNKLLSQTALLFKLQDREGARNDKPLLVTYAAQQLALMYYWAAPAGGA